MNNKKYFLKTSFKYNLVFIMFFCCGFLFSQNKGDKYLKNRMYVKAALVFEKQARKNPDPATLSKLGECQYLLQDYAKAEKTYELLFSKGPVREEDYLRYAMCLKISGNYEKAAQVYDQFLKAYPKSEHYKKVKKFCAEINYWNSRPKEYVVKNCQSINTPRSEFSSHVYNNKLYYTAEKPDFNFVYFYKDDSRNNDFYDLYLAELKSQFPSHSKNLKGSVNTPYHDACMTVSANKMAFSRSELSGKGEIKNPMILLADIQEDKIKKIKPFEHNQPEYIFTHPALGKNGTLLFFVSNMPGGYGGTDIWYSVKNGENWSKPVNAGPDVNTPGNEVFPYYREDGTLFFSSDGHPGFGGLDIYSARQKSGEWIVEKHETLLLNSPYDDFGICFLNDSTGFFTSNRPGGKGKDDIYQFFYKNMFIEFSGYVLNTENPDDPAKNVKVTLKDTLGNFVQETTTDDNGFFVFKNLDANKTYLAYIENPDPAFTGKARYFMTDNAKTIHRISSKKGENSFVFKNLPIQKNSLPELYTDDNVVLAGNLLYGENPSKALKNTKIRLKNEFGDVVEETSTNEFGAFTFKYLPANQTYIIEIVETDIALDENTKITLTNKSGKELKVMYFRKNKELLKILPADKTILKEMYAPDEDLIMNISGYMYDQNKKPLSNIRLMLYNIANPSDKKEITTGANGKFEFRNLEAEKNYAFTTDENDPALKDVEKIYLADHRGRIYKILLRDAKGGFSYKILPADKSLLGEFAVDDPWLQVLELKYKKQKEALTIIENIYYGTDEYKFDAAGKNVLDKVIQILKENPNLNVELSSHTDSRASDDYNLKLSQKRAQYAVDYIIANGIDKKRLKAIGYGETRLLNHCKNNVDCSDEEHKINRRTEFKIVDVTALKSGK